MNDDSTALEPVAEVTVHHSIEQTVTAYRTPDGWLLLTSAPVISGFDPFTKGNVWSFDDDDWLLEGELADRLDDAAAAAVCATVPELGRRDTVRVTAAARR